MVRPTHLLESHVSGQMLKKEETEEGETFSSETFLPVMLYSLITTHLILLSIHSGKVETNVGENSQFAILS